MPLIGWLSVALALGLVAVQSYALVLIAERLRDLDIMDAVADSPNRLATIVQVPSWWSCWRRVSRPEAGGVVTGGDLTLAWSAGPGELLNLLDQVVEEDEELAEAFLMGVPVPFLYALVSLARGVRRPREYWEREVPQERRTMARRGRLIYDTWDARVRSRRMNLDDLKDADENSLGYARGLVSRRGIVKGGIVEYDEESAPRLAPPLAGKCGVITVQDWTEYRVGVLETGADAVAKYRQRLRREERNLAATTTKHGRQHLKEIRAKLSLSDKELLKKVEYLTQEYPAAVQIQGMDDSSFAVFCKTVEEAVEIYDLLVGCQPLNHVGDVVPLGFRFTN